MLLFCLFQLHCCKLYGSNFSKDNILNALIEKSFHNKYKIQGQLCTVQTLYECLVKCDCHKDPSNCTTDSCMFTCYLFSKPQLDCPKNLLEYGRVLSVLMSNKNTFKNSEANCHHRCPWSTHCDQCPNCKWCWLCSSCSIPNKNCKYCRVCKGNESDCAKCCGY